jgi:Zn-finger nucleic acid-binding protein
MMFVGQEFCPHCGAKADRKDAAAPEKTESCPRCKTNLEAVVIGSVSVRECSNCEGVWTDTATLRQICFDQEKQAAVLGMPSHLPNNDGVVIEKQVRYLPCPVCGDLMNRVNFARFSNVIVDVCREHGTWFDRDELRSIVEFIRSGGLDKARAQEMDDLNEARRRANAALLSRGEGSQPILEGDVRHSALSAAAQALFDLLA